MYILKYNDIINLIMYREVFMKKIILFLILFTISISCYAITVGEKINYRTTDLAYTNVDTYLTKVEPTGKDGYYYVEITSIVSPAKSAVGMFAFATHYYVKLKDKITLYKSDYFSVTPITLIISNISNNEIVLSTAAELLNEE